MYVCTSFKKSGRHIKMSIFNKLDSLWTVEKGTYKTFQPLFTPPCAKHGIFPSRSVSGVMNWLQVIKAGRLVVQKNAAAEEEAALKVDVFENDDGKEENLRGLEAAALATVLRTTSTQLEILSMGAITTISVSHPVRDHLAKVLEETETSLRSRFSFSPLFKNAREASSRMQEAQWLEALATRNKTTIATIRAKLQGNQKQKERDIHKKQETIASLKDQIQELVGQRDVALSYAEKSLASQREQALIRNDDEEQQLRSDLQKINDLTDNELNVHKSLITFLNFSIKDFHEQLEKWTIFYTDELIRRNSKLDTIRLKITEEKTRLADLTELYDEHQREINEYLEFKEEKRLEAEHDQFLYDTATKIQAWWRGTMVRRGLGPYKKRKKPAKDKKKKK